MLGTQGNNSDRTIAFLIFDALLVALVVLCVIYHDRPIFVTSRPELPKVTPAYPLVGNLPELLRNLWHDPKRQYGMLHLMDSFQKQFGKGGMPFTMTAPGASFGGRTVAINRPEYIQWAQKTNFENYEKGYHFRKNMQDVLSEHGIFAADGQVWKKQRKMASHIFSVGNFRTHVQKTVQSDLELLMKLAKDAADSGTRLNLPDVMFRFTLDTFGEMAFNANLNCLPTETKGLQEEVPFATAFDFAQQVMVERFFDPFWRFTECFSAQGRQMRRAVKVLRKTCFEIIDKRLANQASGMSMGAVDNKEGKDLLQLFMDMGLQRDELLPVVLNFIIAGRDTTAQALSWAFLELHKHPDIVKKIREEASRVIGDRFMEYDDLKRLPYTNAVFYEVLRLYPSVPKNIKVAVKDDIIRPYAQDLDRTGSDEKEEIMPTERLPDIKVQKGTTVMWSDWVMARMPEIWGEDCKELKPERFLKADGSLRTYSTYKFHAFNAGPRLCLGQTLATYEGMAVLIALLTKYDVVLDDEELAKDPPTYAESLTLPITNPYMATLHPL
ncbi:cytochrome P450 [Tilletiaria anomala UBC 951]|uniref:Cytochrome P450 n=1 Tax=Tilletiaria anomala (strain ATCC 24038 / CBS 436.72 / UBC 951) TaxID=1037660 RepID=A0A066W9K8_TILAU|nr:cytochrome P450 [Tilletiaria anomala UBC 951]KDN47759.1 cytochrome P450 [Tilletiaria anomala UBC 951]